MKFVLLMLMLVALDAFGIPPEAARNKRDVLRNTRLVWGLNAPAATIGAQIEQESGWRAEARSAVGAQGLAQFMPATATWISSINADLASNQPNNPAWALRAIARYDKWLWDRVDAVDNCQRMAKVLSAYNGGLGWIYRDEKVADAKGLHRSIWFDQMETVNAGRAPAMWKENRGYPRRILLKLEPTYTAAGWTGGVCGVP